ncbi:type I polyketide synthase [Actinosynnema sp. CA-299493]
MRRVTAELEQTSDRLREAELRDGEPIAIVAAACRYPGGVRSPEDLWRLVAEGGDAVTPFPEDRGWPADLHHPDPDHPGTSYVRHGGFLHDAAGFDPGLFGISPREALAMDPQQRLLLEVTWEVFERAGIDPLSLRGSDTGVLVGAAYSGYGSAAYDVPEGVEGHLLTGNAGSVVSGRLAYTFGLEGPAVTVDTACSSSLVALHLAVTALRRGDCSLAVAGGVAVMPTPEVFTAFSRQRGLAADGRCKSFAAAADGTGMGEGVGLLLLERLSVARRNGHRVLALVRGTAVNSDGASNGLTAPNGPSQRRVIRKALASARVPASQVDLVEAHGTGTVLGDPIEAQALLATYGQERDEPLWLGSVKSNIGHTQAAAGVAGIIKVVEAVRHGVLPATLHVDEPSPHVDWSKGNIRLLAEARPWPELDRPRRAAVSSFGISGTNAHAVIEQAPAPKPLPDSPESAGVVAWPLSGRTAQALRDQASRLAAHLRANPDLDPRDVGFSLATGRAALAHRAVVVGSSREELAAGLDAVDSRGEAVRGGTAFLFTGQGSQRVGMGRGLAASFPVFAEAWAEVLSHFPAEVREVLTSDDDRIDQTAFAQPGLFAVEVALSRLFASWGVTPDVVVGHSIGEVAAAHVAGVFSLADACRLVVARGALMQALPTGGAMVAVEASEDEITLSDGVSLAALNGPRSVVLSGDEEPVLALAAEFAARGRRTKRLTVSHAFHSAGMDAMLDDFRAVAASVSFGEPQVTFLSTVDDGSVADPEYWVRNVRQTVRFGDAVARLQGVARCVEVGPDAVLTALVPDLPCAPALRADGDEVVTAVSALGAVYATGGVVDWSSLHAGGRTVDLPTYAFQHERFWLDPLPARTAAPSGAETWLYRTTWHTTSVPPTRSLPAGWVVLHHDADADSVRALCDRGATALPVPRDADRAALADVLRQAGQVTEVVALPGTSAEALALVQAVGDAGVGARLWCLVTDDDSDATEAVAGLGRSAAIEVPDRWGGLVRVPGAPDARAWDLLVAVLGGDEDEVAVRAGEVVARRLVRATGVNERWTPRGTVLVTGGTGALGAEVARWVAGAGAQRLVLVSRRGQAAPGAAELAAELSATGVDVVIRSADAADRDALAAVVAEFPPDSVVHTAGVLDDGVLDGLTAERLATASAPKRDAVRVLAELTGDLDAFVVFSSAAATFGAAGQGNYAAANAELDAFARRRTADGHPTTSVAWGPWAGNGMAADRKAAERTARSGFTPMSAGAALDAMAVAVGSRLPSVTIADVDWDTFAPAFTATRRSPLLDGVREARRAPAATSAWADRVAGLPEAERGRAALDLVREMAAAVLGHASAAAVPATTAFRDLGFDSLTAVEFRNLLGAATGLSLPATLVFDFPTPADLADELVRSTRGAARVEARATTRSDDEPIVIVGMACRFPGGVADPEQLWDLLAAGGDAVSGFPADRGWDLDRLFHPDPDHPGTSYVREGGFLHGVAEFDAELFGISPREALAMDPQQRLLLETSWEVFERAGIDPRSVRGAAGGVFVGTNGQDYLPLITGSNEIVDGYIATGIAASVASGRLSYAFGLEGPAITVDTACSSSLVALHLAAQALRSGECDLALAGGVTVMSTPGSFVEFSRQRGLATDGRCKPFAAAADGTGWGEGVGMLLVERLSDARRLGHPVLAVLRGSAVNQDGASNGLTAPNGPSQQRVIRQALANAGLEPSEVDVVEAHGTGTTLGDPIEAQALLATYGQERETPLWLGSVKSNIGHTQAAAGVAGVIKMVQAMRHGVLPKTLHVDAPSPHVDWSSGAVELITESRPWPVVDRPRRAAVSSFGVSGTNAHVLLEHVDDVETAVEERPEPSAVPWVLTAGSPTALAEQAARLRAALTADLPSIDVAHTLATGRAAMPHRAVVIGRDRDALLDGLSALARDEASPALVRAVAGEPGRVVFVFPGQGSQWVGMALELAEQSSVFAERLAECAAALEPFCDWSLHEALRGEVSLDRVDVVQPVLFAVMVSLAALWRSWGIEPAAVVGHSQGEIAAACVSGALSLEDAARVVALRSRVLRRLAGRGGMVSIAASESEVRALIGPFGERISIAAVNGPSAVVVSGEPDALDALVTDGLRAKRIAVDYASHSAQVEELREELAEVLASITPRTGEVPLYSTLTGEVEDGSGLDADYWFRNLRSTVEFASAVERLAGDGFGVFVECSPHPLLTMAVQEQAEDVIAVGSLRRDDGGLDRMLLSLGEAVVRGVTPNWANVIPGGRRVDLPSYAFQRRRYWPGATRAAVGTDPVDDLFWETVEREDLDALSGALHVDSDAGLADVLPALAAWRRRGRELSALDSWRYRTTWHALPDTASGLTGRWLVVAPAGTDDDWCGQVVAALDAGGAEAVRIDVTPGAESTAAVEGSWVGVVSLLALDTAPLADHPQVPAGLAGTTALIRALAEVDAPLWCLTRQAVATGPGEAPDPVAAQVWGLGRVAALEHPRRWGGLVDLPGTVTGRIAERLVGVLSRGDGEDQLAVRTSGVLARRLVRAPLGAVPPRRQWKPTGTVLVTGGTGALGGHVARWLAGRGAPHLLLVGRRGEQAPGAAELAAELRGLGSEVTVAACDTADRAALAALLDRHPVTAVFHAAGVLDDCVLDGLTPERLATVLRPKVDATRALHELTQDLSAFVLFSSLASTTGGAGQGNYAAANAYLDAFAEWRRAQGLTATSVAWGAWGGGGLAEEGVRAQRMRQGGLAAMAPEPAVAALEQALDHDEAVLTVADVDWSRFVPGFTAARPSRLIATIPEAAAIEAGPAERREAEVGGLRARLAGVPVETATELVLDEVRDQIAAVLGHTGSDRIPPEQALKDLGFDSLTAVDLRNRLGASCGLDLPSTLVFDHPTANAITRFLCARLVDGADPSVAALRDLAGLESALGADALDETTRTRILIRLRALLADDTTTEVGEGTADALDDATDDEMFTLLGTKFGIS